MEISPQNIPQWAKEYKSQVEDLRDARVVELQSKFPELRSKLVRMATYREREYSLGLELIREEFSRLMQPVVRVYQLQLNYTFFVSGKR